MYILYIYTYNTPRYVRVTSSHVTRQQIRKHKQLKLTSDESSWCTPFSLKLWGTVSGLFAGELMFQFGFSSTRQKRSETWGWEKKRVGKIEWAGIFDSSWKIVWGNPTLPHLETGCCGEWILGMWHVSCKWTQRTRFVCCKQEDILWKWKSIEVLLSCFKNKLLKFQCIKRNWVSS